MSVVDDDGFDWETMSGPSDEAPDGEDVGQPSEEEAPEAVTEPQDGERLRDEKGRFVKQEEVEADEPDDAVIAARERHGDDDPDKLLKIIADQTAHTRELQSKLDKLTHLQEQQLEYAQRQAEPQYDYDELADEDPAQATILAFEKGDPAFARAYQSWAEEDPGAASAWLVHQEMQVLRAELQQQTGPLYAQNLQAQQQQAVAQFGREHPDVTQYASEMSKIIDERPHWKIVLEQGPPDAKITVLRDAYEAAKARNAATLHTAGEQIGKAQAQAQEQALQDAFVASASNAVREAPEPSMADQLSEGWESHGLYWGK